jgi:glycosyltransferase involved in cell wall biosynthesis
MDPAQVVLPRPSGKCRFLFVGQGIQRKGLHHLIRAWQARPRPGASLTLVCYRIDPAIASLITDSGIQLLPRRSPEELAEHYRQADVFAMPSLIEGFGLVYLEALAHGCHVLGTTNTGLPDLNLGDAAATVIEPGDIASLDAALSELIDRKREAVFDPQAIANRASRWSWADFRQGVVSAVGAAQPSSNSACKTRRGS